jgi:hypothetical protein
LDPQAKKRKSDESSKKGKDAPKPKVQKSVLSFFKKA